MAAQTKKGTTRTKGEREKNQQKRKNGHQTVPSQRLGHQNKITKKKRNQHAKITIQQSQATCNSTDRLYRCKQRRQEPWKEKGGGGEIFFSQWDPKQNKMDHQIRIPSHPKKKKKVNQTVRGGTNQSQGLTKGGMRKVLKGRQ